MRIKVALLSLTLAGAALAQGFADMGADVSGFATPDADKNLTFPADHGPHPDYRIEWWYLTATLTGADGADYGVQWTLFRTATSPSEAEGWQSPQLWMGHAAATSATGHFVAERLARGGTGQAGVTLGDAAPFEAWIDDWQMLSLAPPDADPLSHLSLGANGPDFRYRLELAAEGPLVLHGEGGYSVKSAAGQASNYYSQPFYTVTGQLDLPGGPVAVTGQAWLDREWSSQPLAPDQTGWDWFSLAFDSGERLMGFRLRDAGDGFTSGTWIAADGTPTPLSPNALIVEPLDIHKVAGRDVPVTWRLTLPERDLDVTLQALNPDAWMATSVPYWEGPITLTGSHAGRGYLEMTGY